MLGLPNFAIEDFIGGGVRHGMGALQLSAAATSGVPC
ncbi:MAG: hypothetical protein ACI9ZV_000002 [Candidatus Azotimanducaceae bacterium]|jgi:hypothetical protein